MIDREFYRTREDGVNLYRTFTNKNVYIRQEQTGEEYPVEAIDVENAPYTYIETDIPIEGEGDLTVTDALEMLNEMGGSMSMISKQKLRENVNKAKREIKGAF